MSKKITENKISVSHPLEKFFDIEDGSTEMVEYSEETELIIPENYDEKDNEIDQNFQEIYNRAMEGFEIMSEDMEEVDPKYRARMGEVSLQHLNVALVAAKNKAGLKQHKDNLDLKEKTSKTPSKVVNNNIIIDRNELLDKLMLEDEENIIDVDSEE
jgi:hypothetical protein